MDQTKYTLPGIMHYLQNQYTIIEKNKILHELEKSELKLKITKLESERNSLLLENSKLTEKVKELQLNLQNGDSSELTTMKDSDDDIDQLKTTIDTTNLIRARQFLKNTTNEILYLLNSPSIDNADPLELSKEEHEFLTTRTDPFGEIHNNNNNNNNNNNGSSLSQTGKKTVLDPPHRINPPNESNGNSIIANKDKPFSLEEFPIESDTETITNGNTDDEEDEIIPESVLLHLQSFPVNPPVKFMKVDNTNGLIYIYGENGEYVVMYNTKDNKSHKLQITKGKDINHRVFAIDSKTSILIEGFGNATEGGLSVCSSTGSLKNIQFESPIKLLDIFSKDDYNDDDDDEEEEVESTVLAVLLQSGQVQIFEIDNGQNITPHQHSLLSELPPDTIIDAIKFNNQSEITLITTQGRVLRYDFVNDCLIYNLNVGVNLAESSCFQMSLNFFIQEFSSSSLSVLDLLSQELKTYVIESPFKVISISIAREYFTLNYANGTIELYDLTMFDEVESIQDQDDYPIYKNSRSLPKCLKKIDYYKNHRKPSIIKDIVVDLVLDGKNVKIIATGSDLNVKEYVV